jgi:hypothetical protein
MGDRAQMMVIRNLKMEHLQENLENNGTSERTKHETHRNTV